MPIVTRRYKFLGPDNSDLTKFVGNSAARNTTFYDTIIDIDIDNAVADALATLDEFMSSIGWSFDAAAVAPVHVAIQQAADADAALVTANADTLIDDMTLTLAVDGGYLVQFTATALTQSVT
jgi:hypothetical protein